MPSGESEQDLSMGSSPRRDLSQEAHSTFKGREILYMLAHKSSKSNQNPSRYPHMINKCQPDIIIHLLQNSTKSLPKSVAKLSVDSDKKRPKKTPKSRLGRPRQNDPSRFPCTGRYSHPRACNCDPWRSKQKNFPSKKFMEKLNNSLAKTKLKQLKI